MHIKTFEIENYKSFQHSGSQTLSPNFNVVVGQNSAGKSALLEALGTKFSNQPHHKVGHPQNVPLLENSRVKISLALSGTELKEILLNQTAELHIPVPIALKDQDQTKYLNSIFARPEICFRFEKHAQGGFQTSLASSNITLEKTAEHDIRHIYRRNLRDMTFDYAGTSHEKGDPTGLIANFFLNSAYLFRAERFNLAICNVGTNTELAPNAENLAEVLNILQPKKNQFSLYCALVREVLPVVTDVSVRPLANGRVGIHVKTAEDISDNGDINFLLSECGTGIGQVLAILYVVIFSAFSRVILIDEPNSFLHPGAARRLIQILRRYSRHQYILTTHSPEVVRSASMGAIIHVTLAKGESRLEIMSATDTTKMREMLEDVGARISDLFQAENLVWVEGQTERICFPLILRIVAPATIEDICFLPIISTGELSKKGRTLTTVLDIYRRLSQASALGERHVKFVLDRESLTAKEIEDLKRASKSVLEFIPRRMFENYLLHIEAIAACFNELSTFSDCKLTSEEVQQWIVKHGQEAPYSAEHYEPLSEKWLEAVDGAAILKNMLTDLSQTKEAYQKVEHGQKITAWIAEHDPQSIQELSLFLKGQLERKEN